MTATDPETAVAWVRAAVTERLAAAVRERERSGQPPMTPAQRRQLGESLTESALDEHARAALAAGRPVLDPATEQRVAHAVRDALFGMGGLQALLDDPRVENVNATGCDQVWVGYGDGARVAAAPIAASDDELIALIRQLAARSGFEERRFDRGSPILNLELPDGSRLSAVMAVTPRPCLAVRRHRFRAITLDELIRLGTVDAALAAFLRAVVAARRNVIVAGATGIGKTTLLRGLASVIGPEEHIVTVEDARELNLDHDRVAHPRVTTLQAREANIEGEGAISQAQLVWAALRLNPDRVIVGEVRGPEVITMCNAMSMGTDGSMATIHASTSRGVFGKLAAYAVQGPERLGLEAVNLMVASAVHFIVHLTRSSDGRRVVSSVREVVDADGAQVVSNEVFRPGSDGRAVPAVPLRTETVEQLAAVGFDPGVLSRPGSRWSA